MTKLEEAFSAVSPEDQKLIQNIVGILNRLKEMDVERIQFILNNVQKCRPLLPEEMQSGFECLETDFKLILFFIEQARTYDNTSKAVQALGDIFGNLES